MLAPAADEPVPQRPAVSNDPASRSAADRWKRLKSQYTPTPATRLPRIEQPTQTTDTAPPIRPIPEAGPADVHSVSTSPEGMAESARKSAAAAVPMKEEEPEWVLPVPTTSADLETRASDLEPRVRADQTFDSSLETSPRALGEGQVQEKPPYEEKKDVKSPLDPDPTIRRVTPAAPGEPPRKTTQIRRIGDIAPLNDFNKDTDIKKYATEKAQEFNVKFGGEAYTPREFPDTVLPWAAPESKYYPLYFQDPALERYGHSHHPLLQPVISSARVSGQLVMMPYQMAITPPWELHSPLGYYRPGDVVPKLKYRFPWNTTAAAIEAASVVGFIYLIP